jgi:cysteinyl-tRNA synthetase
MNVTDVDDKTITGSIQENIPLKEYTEKFTKIFFDDLKKLNIEIAEHTPKATESIDAMQDIIEALDKNGLVYEKDGSIYFSISKYKEYGKLSNLDQRDIQTGISCSSDEYDKDDARDFALWKAPKENEPCWEISSGKGRPGWHIECSAMVRKIFGTTIDIHTGGVDLIFPHHENEIAQSEAAYNEKFVRYWVHAEHLLVDGAKMSKSKGNFYTLHDLLEKGYKARNIRYLLLSAHYRKQLNFTLTGLDSASQPLSRIDNFINRLENITQQGEITSEVNDSIKSFIVKFTETMDNDLNISGSIGHMFDFIHQMNSLINENKLNKNEAELIYKTMQKLDSVLGFIFMQDEEAENIDEERIKKLIQERKDAKDNKDWARSDEIRDLLLAENIILEDGKEGTTWKIKR